MKISLKVLGLLWVGLFCIIGALLFNAYSKFSPETFIALITEQVHKNYPGANLEVGKIDYRFSLDFNLNLQNIHLRREGKLLSSIGEVELKVPWWLLLVDRGNAHINLKDLDIYVDHENPVIERKKVPGPTSQDLIKVNLPSYLAGARFTVRAKNITIKDIYNSRRYFVLSKLLVREFHYGKNSAFELNIPVSIKQKDISYKSELWLFGDVTPDPSSWAMNFRGEFRTKENSDKFQIDDIIIGGKADFSPATLNISSSATLEIDKKTIGSGTLKADKEALGVNLKFDGLPLSYFGFIYEEIKNPYLKTLSGTASGSIAFHKPSTSGLSKVSGKLNFPGNFDLPSQASLAGKWQVIFEDSRWEVSFMSPKGEASFFRRSYVDPRKHTVTQYVEELGFSGLDMALSTSPVPGIVDFISETPGTYYTTTISFKNCFLGDQLLNGGFKHGFSPAQKFFQGQLKAEKSQYKIAYTEKISQHALDISFSDFQWDKSYNFLSPLFRAEGALLNGKAQGRWGDYWPSGEWLLDVKVSNLSNGQGKLEELLSESLKYFSLDPNNYSGRNLHIIGKNDVFTLSSLFYEDKNIVKISGKLSTKENSFLTLSVPGSKTIRPIRKEVIEPYWIVKEEL